MGGERRVEDAWIALPLGARVALEEQWAGLAAGGLPCGSAILSADGRVLCAGYNRAYDPAGPIEIRAQSPLQHTRLAHAELNALALVPTEFDRSTTRRKPRGFSPRRRGGLAWLPPEVALPCQVVPPRVSRLGRTSCPVPPEYGLPVPRYLCSRGETQERSLDAVRCA